MGTKVMVAALFPAATAAGNGAATLIRARGGGARAVARALFTAELLFLVAYWAVGAAVPPEALASSEAPCVFLLAAFCTLAMGLQCSALREVSDSLQQHLAIDVCN